MFKLETIAQPLPLSKMAYEALRDSILTGKMLPGEIYNELVLARELGISRTPVREALLELASQGLVTFLPRRGVQVNHYSRQDVEEIFELRTAIELLAVEKAAMSSPRPDLSRADHAMIDQRKATRSNSITFLQADREFHATFSELTNNRRLVSALDNIRDMVQVMGMQALTRGGRVDEVIIEHENVLEAVRQGNPEEARKAMAYHLDRSREAVLTGSGSEAED